MTEEELDARLAASLADGRLSRAERQDLMALVASPATAEAREALRRRAFALARATPREPGDLSVIDWLEDVVRATVTPPAASTRIMADAYFSPGEDCPRAIQRFLRGAVRSVDICVFTITDDLLSGSILDAHRRGVSVRVITDDAKAEDLGSDVDRLERAGIAVRVDRSPFHMHHKFAVADRRTLLTGSYNWTRGAARDNVENLVIVDESRLVVAFAGEFDQLWTRLA